MEVFEIFTLTVARCWSASEAKHSELSGYRQQRAISMHGFRSTSWAGHLFCSEDPLPGCSSHRWSISAVACGKAGWKVVVERSPSKFFHYMTWIWSPESPVSP